MSNEQKKTEETIEGIEKTINWYNANCESQDLDMFQRALDWLSNSTYYLGKIAADIKHQYNKKVFVRTIYIEEKKNNILKHKLETKVNRAEIVAKLEYKEELETELNYQALAYKYDVMVRQCNRIMDAMRSRITTLRAEREREFSFESITRLFERFKNG